MVLHSSERLSVNDYNAVVLIKHLHMSVCEVAVDRMNFGLYLQLLATLCQTLPAIIVLRCFICLVPPTYTNPRLL